MSAVVVVALLGAGVLLGVALTLGALALGVALSSGASVEREIEEALRLSPPKPEPESWPRRTLTAEDRAALADIEEIWKRS
jgi:hypothetical protein